MAILNVLNADSSILRQKSKKVRNVDGSIQRLIDDMIETMRAIGGAGLAAPQVGVPLRIVVVEPPEGELLVLINPEIVRAFGERLVEEGCLSLPGYRGEIKRSVAVTVKGRDRRGRGLRVKAEDLLAQVLEHEIDHVNGTLYFDHLESQDQLYRMDDTSEISEGTTEGSTVDRGE